MADHPQEREGDELLTKLDRLMTRHRSAGEEAKEPPMLRSPVPAAAAGDIPTLTDAVAGPAVSARAGVSMEALDEQLVRRLTAAIERQIAQLSDERPSEALRLRALRATLIRLVEEFVRRALGRSGPQGGDRPDR